MSNPEFRLAEYQGKWYPQVRWKFFGIIPYEWQAVVYYPGKGKEGEWGEDEIKYKSKYYIGDEETVFCYGKSKADAEGDIEAYIRWHERENKKEIITYHNYTPKGRTV